MQLNSWAAFSECHERHLLSVVSIFTGFNWGNQCLQIIILFSLVVMCTFADACIKILNVLLESASHLTSKGIGPHACTLQWPLSCGQLTLRVVKTPKLVIYTSGYIQSTYSLHWFLAELLKSLLSASAFTATATVSLCCSGWGCCSLWQFLESGNYKSSLQSPCLHHAHALRTIFGAFFFFFSEMEILWFLLTLIDA